MSTSSVPIISRTECMDNCGTPTSTVRMPVCALDDWTDGGSAAHVVFHDKLLGRDTTEFSAFSKHVRGECGRRVPLVGVVLDDDAFVK